MLTIKQLREINAAEQSPKSHEESADMTAPRVTVLMPVYNGEKFLREAIESVLKQSFADFEFLIINDGSTDGSLGIIQSFSDPRIRVINNPSNLKIVASLNRGLEFSRSKYVARMDCDDISLPDRLERQVRFLDRHGQVGIAGTWAETFGSKKRTLKLPTSHHCIQAELLFNSAFVHPSVMMRMEILRQHGIRYRLENGVEDYDLWLQLARVTQLANIPEVMIHYRCHDDGFSAKNQALVRTHARPLYDRELKRLGIEACESELGIHELFGLEQFTDLGRSAGAAGNWLNKLYEANRIMRRYHFSSFARVLGSRWYEVCLTTPGSFTEKVRAFFSAPFANLGMLKAVGARLGL